MVTKMSVFVAGTLCLLFICALFYDRIWLISICWPLNFLFIRRWEQYKKEKKIRFITDQFKMFLYSLTTTLSTGKSLENALVETYSELSRLYHTNNNHFLACLLHMNSKVRNGTPVEQAVIAFSEQLNNEDIKQFGRLIHSIKRQSGDLLSVTKTAAQLLAEKIEVEQEIQIVISQKKFESNLILMVPFVFLSLLKWSSPDYLNVLYYTNLGIVLMTFALILLMISYWMLRKIMRIQI